MNEKLTRRAVLGTIIGGLAVCPFVVRALWKYRPITMGPDSFLAGLRTRFSPLLSFPREFDIENVDISGYAGLEGSWADRKKLAKRRKREAIDMFRSLSQEDQNIITETQRKYWRNFAQIDEIEFDCASFGYNKDGTKRIHHGSMEAHVRMKYGYGLEIVGKDAEGKPIHWIFNLGGDISPVAREFNIATMAKGFFEAYEAEPQEALLLPLVVAVDADLPDNPYLKNDKKDKYTVLSPNYYLKDPTILPPHIRGKSFCHKYFNQRTGILEYLHARTYQERVFTQATDADGRWIGPYFFNPKYADPAEPLPEPGEIIRYKKTAEVAEGIFLPVECAHVEPEWANGFIWRATYSNIRVKRV